MNERLIPEETQQQKRGPRYQNQSPQVETRLRVCLGGGWGTGSALLLRPHRVPLPARPPRSSPAAAGVPSPSSLYPSRAWKSPRPRRQRRVQVPEMSECPGLPGFHGAMQIFQTFLNGISEQGGLPRNQGQTGSCRPTLSEEIRPPPHLSGGKRGGLSSRSSSSGGRSREFKTRVGSAHETDQPGRRLRPPASTPPASRKRAGRRLRTGFRLFPGPRTRPALLS